MALTATFHVDIVRIRMCVTIQQATVQTVVRISGQETGVRVRLYIPISLFSFYQQPIYLIVLFLLYFVSLYEPYPFRCFNGSYRYLKNKLLVFKIHLSYLENKTIILIVLRKGRFICFIHVPNIIYLILSVIKNEFYRCSSTSVQTNK